MRTIPRTAFAGVCALVLAACATVPGGGGASWSTADEGEPPAQLVVLLKQLDTDNVKKRVAVFDEIGKLGAPAVPTLLRRLASDSMWDRFTAAAALGKIRDRRAVEPLIWAMSTQDPMAPKGAGSVRSAAADALGSIGDPRAVGPLISQASDPIAAVRRDVAWALSQFGTARVLIALERMKKDRDAEVRKWVGRAFGFAFHRYQSHGDPDAVPTFVAALDDRDRAVGVLAAEQLGRKRDGRAVSPLLRALANRGVDKEVRAKVADALGKIGDRRAVPALIDSLRDRHIEVRGFAAIALGRLRDPRSSAGLVAAMKRLENQELKALFVRALGQTRGAGAYDALMGEFRSGNLAAVMALGELRDRRAFEPLVVRLNSSDKNVRGNVVHALGNLGDPRAVVPLIGILDDPDKNVRGLAATALSRIDLAPALKPVLEAAGRNDAAAIQAAFADPERSRLAPALALYDLVEQLDVSGEKPLGKSPCIGSWAAALSKAAEKPMRVGEFIVREPVVVRKAAAEALARAGAFAVLDPPPIPEVARAAVKDGAKSVRSGSLYEAEQRFRCAVAHAPWWASVRYNLGRIYQRMGQPEKAIRELEFYLALDPDATDSSAVKAMIDKLRAKQPAADPWS